MGQPVSRDGAPGCDQCLRHDLTTKKAALGAGTMMAAKDVVLDLLEVEDVDQLPESLMHDGMMRHGLALRPALRHQYLRCKHQPSSKVAWPPRRAGSGLGLDLPAARAKPPWELLLSGDRLPSRPADV
jgi:hypothetical protein